MNDINATAADNIHRTAAPARMGDPEVARLISPPNRVELLMIERRNVGIALLAHSELTRRWNCP